MKSVCLFSLVWLTVCVCLVVATGSVGVCSQEVNAVKETVQGGSSRVQVVMGRMRKHYASLQTAVLTAETITSSVVDGKAGDEEKLLPYRACFQSPDLYGSDTEEPRRLSPLSKSQVDELGRALENPAVGRLIIIPQLFQGFQIAETFPKVAYKGQKPLSGERADVVVFERDEGTNFGVGGSTVVTLWVNQLGQLKRFEVALTATFSNPNLKAKDLINSYRTDISVVEDGPLPSSFLSKVQGSKSLPGTMPGSTPTGQEVMRRMTKHYTGLKTAVLTVSMTRNMGLDAKTLDDRKFGTYQVYFQSPDLYGSDIEEPRRLSPLSKSDADQYGGALVDPAFGYLIIIPQLFQGFQIADTFSKVSHQGQESIGGEKTDVMVLERDLPGPAGYWVSGVNTLTLWVNERGQLRRFDLAFRSSKGKADPGNKDVEYSFRAELAEVDNGPLPSFFLKKAPQAK